MGFWRNVKDNYSKIDIEGNSTRIRETVDSLDKLRSRRARMSDKHKIYKINCEIGDLNFRLGSLKDERDRFHEKNYSHEPEAYTKNLGKLKTAKKILVLFIVCCLALMAIVLLPF